MAGGAARLVPAAAAALGVEADQIIKTPGKLVVAERFYVNDPGRAREFVDWIYKSNPDGFGQLDFTGAVANSSNVYFYNTSGKIAIDAAGGNVDAIMPLFINQAMPDIFVVIFMLTLLSAAMSTLSALYHAMGTALVCDLWGRGRECARSLRAHQAGIVIMMVLSTVLAFLLPIGIIARATAMFMGLCACAFLPAFAVGVYARAPSTKAALCSMVSGALAWFFWTAFIHAAEAKPLGLCQAVFGKVTLLGSPWTAVDPIVIALPVSFVVMVVLQWQYSSVPEAGSAVTA